MFIQIDETVLWVLLFVIVVHALVTAVDIGLKWWVMYALRKGS